MTPEHRYRHAHDPAGPVVRGLSWVWLLAWGAACGALGILVGRMVP